MSYGKKSTEALDYEILCSSKSIGNGVLPEFNFFINSILKGALKKKKLNCAYCAVVGVDAIGDLECEIVGGDRLPVQPPRHHQVPIIQAHVEVVVRVTTWGSEVKIEYS